MKKVNYILHITIMTGLFTSLITPLSLHALEQTNAHLKTPPPPQPGEPYAIVQGKVYGRDWVLKQIERVKSKAGRKKIAAAMSVTRRPNAIQKTIGNKWISNEPLSTQEQIIWHAYGKSVLSRTAALALVITILLVLFGLWKTNVFSGASEKIITAQNSIQLWNVIAQKINEYMKQIQLVLKGTRKKIPQIPNISDIHSIETSKRTEEDNKKILSGIESLLGKGIAQGPLRLLYVESSKSGLPIPYETLAEWFGPGNFSRVDHTLLHDLNIDENGTNVYQFLGYTNISGPQQTAQNMLDTIHKKIDQLKQEEKYKNEHKKLNELGRQLEYFFKTEQQKETYDAFLKGQGTVAKISETLASSLSENLVTLIDALQELERAIRGPIRR